MRCLLVASLWVAAVVTGVTPGSYRVSGADGSNIPGRIFLPLAVFSTGHSVAVSALSGSTASPSSDDRLSGQVSVLDFGADPTGVAPSDAAFSGALTAAFANVDPKVNKLIRVPAGTYLITRPNLLNSWSAATAFRAYVTIAGDGMGNTKLIFRPTTAAAYLYDGVAAAKARFMLFTVRDLMIVCDDSASGGTVNLFRENGANDGHPDQSFAFFNDRFDAAPNHPGTLLRIEGSVNGSENRFVACRGYSWSSVISSVNPQAVNHYVIGCDWELTQGAVYYFNGGGQLTVIGGSYILGTAGRSTGGNLLWVDSPAAGITGTFSFVGVRTEVYDSAAVLYKLTGQNNGALVNALSVTHRVNNTGGQFGLAQVNSYAGIRLLFKNSDLTGNGLIRFTNSQGTPAWTVASADASSVILEDCELGADPTSLVSWEAKAQGGLFRVRNAHLGGSVTGTTAALATDLDMTGFNGWASGRNTNPIQVKSISGFVAYWPNPAQPSLQAVKLPVGSIVKAIRVRKTNKGDNDGSAYQLTVTNGDGSYTYGTGVLSTRGSEHNIMLENVNRYVAAAGVNQTITITCTPRNCGDNLYQGLGPGDMVIVEYY